MTDMYRCDICRRVADSDQAKDESWYKVTLSPMFPIGYTTVVHYCGRCAVLYNAGLESAKREYEKIKGTEYDMYRRNEDGDD